MCLGVLSACVALLCALFRCVVLCCVYFLVVLRVVGYGLYGYSQSLCPIPDILLFLVETFPAALSILAATYLNKKRAQETALPRVMEITSWSTK